MTKTLRLLLLTAAVATVALGGGVARAMACGNNGGYSYAGIGAPTHAYGVSALISPLDALDVLNGHVAGWVGVGGPGEGPNGSNEWIQVGYAGFPSITGSDIYYEVAQPGRYPTYHQVSAVLDVGSLTKVTVLEIHGRANWWRDGRELGRRDGRNMQHVPLSLPPRLDRPCSGRRLASAHGRLPDSECHDSHSAGARFLGLPRRGRPAGLPASRRYFLIKIGVPSGASDFNLLAVAFETRTHPCETALPSSCGRLVPWMPTTPPPGHSVSFE